MRLFRIAVFMFAFCGALFYVVSLVHFQHTLEATQHNYHKKQWLENPPQIRVPRNLSESNEAIPNKKSFRQRLKEQRVAANEKRAHKKHNKKAARQHHRQPDAKGKEAAVTNEQA